MRLHSQARRHAPDFQLEGEADRSASLSWGKPFIANFVNRQLHVPTARTSVTTEKANPFLPI
jgi:hypothetical protein